MPAARPASLARHALLLALLHAGSATASPPIHHWIDAQGQHHYGSLPPEGVESRSLDTPPAPPAPADDAGTQQRLERYRQSIEAAARERAERQRTRDEAAEARRIRERHCRAARADLEALNSGQMIDEQHFAYYLTEEERRQRIAAIRRQIEEFCD